MIETAQAEAIVADYDSRETAIVRKYWTGTRYWPEGMSMPGNTEILAHGTREGEDHPNDFSRENGDGRHEEPSNVRAG